MSHYIVAHVPGSKKTLNMGIGTLCTLSHSGFDLYMNYDARACHAGISGSGGARAIDERLARKALARALGWAAALRDAFPEDFGPTTSDLPDLFAVPRIDDPGLQGEAIQECLDVQRELERWTSDCDSRNRVCDRVDEIVAFAEAVYLASRQGPVEISFG